MEDEEQARREKARLKSRKWFLANRERSRAHGAQWRAANPKRHQAITRRQNAKQKVKRLSSFEEYLKYKLIALKTSAKSRGIEFSLTERDLAVPEKCPILGIEVSLHGDKGSLPSVDRIDNSKGYVEGNVSMISWRANSLKSNMGLQEIKNLLAYVEMHEILS